MIVLGLVPIVEKMNLEEVNPESISIIIQILQDFVTYERMPPIHKTNIYILQPTLKDIVFKEDAPEDFVYLAQKALGYRYYFT